MRDLHSKKQHREYLHLSHFIRKYEGFPAGDCTFDDKPDLLVDTKKHILGIEHTQLFVSNDSPDPSAAPQAQEELQNRVVEQARTIHEACGRPMLWLYADSNRHFVLNKRAVQGAASALANTVSKVLILFPQEKFVDVWISVDRWQFVQKVRVEFPDGIDGIHFKYVDDPGLVLWGVPRSGIVPRLSPEQIQNEIIKKEAKLESYRNRCNEIWLLMVAEAFSPSSHYELPSDISSHTFETQFDRVFFFNTASDKVVELSIELPGSL